MALDDDMTTPPQEPDSGTPADRAAGSIPEDEYLGRDGDGDADADAGADGGATGGAAGGADGNDATTEAEEDTRFA